MTAGDELINARLGYEKAVDMWLYEVQAIWSRFNIFLLANSIVLAIAIDLGESAEEASYVSSSLRFLVPLLGLVMCGIWQVLTLRGFDYHDYWIRVARQLEQDYLDPVSTLSGPIRRNPSTSRISRSHTRLRTRTAALTLIAGFAFIYVAVLADRAIGAL
jgi:hypothetical protein